MENLQKDFITSSGKKLVRCSLVHEKQIMDELVLLNRSTGTYYTLNDTGAAIWKYCAQGRRWDEILDFVSHEYQMEKKILEEEIYSYLQTLVQEGIFEVR